MMERRESTIILLMSGVWGLNFVRGIWGRTNGLCFISGIKMPGIVVFKRRWSAGSDDFVLPALTLMILHGIWWGFLLFTLYLWCAIDIKIYFFKHLNNGQSKIVLRFCVSLIQHTCSCLFNHSGGSCIPLMMQVIIFFFGFELIFNGG